jgi:hypothetical protein
MTPTFRRQFAVYADYHRDQRNCAMHVVGTPLLFLAAVLPLSLVSVTVFGLHTTAAVLLVIPALLFWMTVDLAIGRAAAAGPTRQSHSHADQPDVHSCKAFRGPGVPARSGRHRIKKSEVMRRF